MTTINQKMHKVFRWRPDKPPFLIAQFLDENVYIDFLEYLTRLSKHFTVVEQSQSKIVVKYSELTHIIHFDADTNKIWAEPKR